MQIIKTYPTHLQKEIKLFYSVIATAEEHRNIKHRRLPDGTLDVVFNLGEPVYQSGDGTKFTEMPGASLTGLYHEKTFFFYKGAVHLVGAVFNPGFAHLFIKDGLHNYKMSTCDSSLIFGNNVNLAIEQMLGMKEEKEKHLLLENFLCSQIQEQRDAYYLSRIALAIEHIQLSKGSAEIKSLCKDYFMSERNFRRKFNEYVGIPPKKYASIVRVKTFCKLYKSTAVHYQKIAEKLEYSDRPHLCNDFRKITGSDPTSYFKQMSTLGNKFIDLI